MLWAVVGGIFPGYKREGNYRTKLLELNENITVVKLNIK